VRVCLARRRNYGILRTGEAFVVDGMALPAGCSHELGGLFGQVFVVLRTLTPKPSPILMLSHRPAGGSVPRSAERLVYSSSRNVHEGSDGIHHHVRLIDCHSMA
jgi:hypothetical protein